MSKPDSSGSKTTRLVLISFCEIEALGVRTLHSFLKENGVDVEIIFLKDRIMNDINTITDSDINTLLSQVAQLRPDIVGLSFFSASHRDAVKITHRLQKDIGVPVIWGGIHAIVQPEESIKTADAVCIGEGEYALLELCRRFSDDLPYTDILGLWVRKNNNVYRNEHRPLIHDLDSLPFFDYSDMGKHYIHHGRVVTHGEPFHENTDRGLYFQNTYVIQTTRGCPFRCSYCSNKVPRCH